MSTTQEKGRRGYYKSTEWPHWDIRIPDEQTAFMDHGTEKKLEPFLCFTPAFSVNTSYIRHMRGPSNPWGPYNLSGYISATNVTFPLVSVQMHERELGHSSGHKLYVPKRPAVTEAGSGREWLHSDVRLAATMSMAGTLTCPSETAALMNLNWKLERFGV